MTISDDLFYILAPTHLSDGEALFSVPEYLSISSQFILKQTKKEKVKQLIKLNYLI